jgi:hypothetical protein
MRGRERLVLGLGPRASRPISRYPLAVELTAGFAKLCRHSPRAVERRLLVGPPHKCQIFGIRVHRLGMDPGTRQSEQRTLRSHRQISHPPSPRPARFIARTYSWPILA